MEQLDGIFWSSIAAVLSPMTGAVGGVVIGAIGVDRWRDELARRERELWVTKAADFVRREHDYIRRTLADLGAASYEVVVPLLAEHDQIPEDLIRGALQAAPYTPPTLYHEGEPIEAGMNRTIAAIAEAASDVVGHSFDGPLPWAADQIEALGTASNGRGRLSVDPRPLLHPNWEGASNSTMTLRAVAPLLKERADELHEVMRDLTLEIYRPLRDELAEDGSSTTAVELLSQSRALVRHARDLANSVDGQAADITHDMEAAHDDESRAEAMVYRLHVLGKFFAAVREISKLMRDQTEALASFKDAGSDAFIGAIKEMNEAIGRTHSDIGRRMLRQDWESFKRTATPVGRPLAPMS